MKNIPTWVRWRVMGVLIFASFASYVLRANFSLAAPAMIEDLALTEIQWGWVMAAFTAGYAIFQFPGGLFGDRLGPRKALTLIAVGWGILTIVTTLVPGPEAASTSLVLGSLILVRFLVGMTHAPIFPISNVFVQRWFPVGGWAFPTGLSSTGLTLGFAAAAPALAWMVVAWGWRTAFLVLAPLGFIVAALWWWYSRDEPREHPAVNEAEVALIEKGREEPREDASDLHWWEILKNRNVLLLTLSYFCMGFVFYDVFNWFFYYLVNSRGMSEIDAGLVSSSQWIAGAVGAALGGWICDRLCRRLGLRWGCRWPVIGGMLISGVLLISGSFSPNAVVAMWFFVFCFFFNQLTEGGYWATSIAIGGRHAGAAGGVMNTGNNVMGVINALLVPGIAASLGWDVAMAMGGFFAILGAGLMFLVRPDEPIEGDYEIEDAT